MWKYLFVGVRRKLYLCWLLNGINELLYTSTVVWLHVTMGSHASTSVYHSSFIWTASSEFGTYRLCEQRRCSLARTFAARSYKQWVKRNLQTESQIPGPSEWLGMRSYNLSWRNARRHKFAWRGSSIRNKNISRNMQLDKTQKQFQNNGYREGPVADIEIEPRHKKMCLRESPTRQDTNWPAQLQRSARILKFWIYKVEVSVCLGSEQQRHWSDCAHAQADLRLCC